MHDLRILREQLDSIRQQLGNRAADVPWDKLEKLLESRRTLVSQVDTLRHQLKAGSDEVAQLKRTNQPTDASMANMRAIGDHLKSEEDHLRNIEKELESLALRIPNIPHESVPSGENTTHNQEIRQWGQPPEFSFPPKPHWDLGETLGILDFDRASKIAGSRFALSLGVGAHLERALANFMMELHLHEHGYTEILPPFLVNRSAMMGTGQLPKFESDLFHLQGDDYFLIPTAEVPITNLYRDEILPETALPLRYVASTPCFRREAGAAGQDTRGLIRVHQFNKIELVTFTCQENSYDELEHLTQAAEVILQRLGLHYRVVMLCTGDLGFAAAKTYDLEVWIPSQQTYREISSCSNFETFQARRMNLRYRPKNGKPNYLHTLNGSGVAIGRTVVAILENYQQADGSIIIPQALRPYLHGLEKITMPPQN